MPAELADNVGQLEVRVVHRGNQPLRDVRVTIQTIHNDRAYLAALSTTDDDGTARFTNLPSGVTWILADKSDFARSSSATILTDNPQKITLTMGPAHSLEVTVRDENNTPIPNANLVVHCADPVGFAATTDDKGRASLDRLCAPPYTVEASAHGFESTVWTDTNVANLVRPIPITLRKLGWIDVSVIDPSGDPAPLSTVLVSGPTIWPARKTQTNAFGRTKISGLAAGTYDLRATRAGLASPITTGVQVERGQGTRVKLLLTAARQVIVRVVSGSSKDAASVTDASVVLVENGVSSFPLQGRTGGDGTVRLGPIPPGPATVSARAEGFVSPGAVALEPDQTSVTVALLKAATLTGEVVDNHGFPIPGCSLEVIGTDIAGLPISETSASIAFRHSHFAWALQGPPALIPIGELGVMPGPIPPIPRLGEPLPRPSQASAPSTPSPVAPWVTNRHGRFTLTPVPPGRVSAIARHPAYVEAISEAVTLAPGTTAHVRIVLYAGGTLQGIVVDDKQFPVVGAIVRITAKQGSTERTTLSDINGEFSFSAVAPSVVLTVSRPESPEVVAYQDTIDVKQDERKEVRIELPRLRPAIAIRITDDRGYPIDRVQVRALSLTADVSLRRTTFSDRHGEATIDDAAGIRLRLEVSAQGYATVVETFETSPETWNVKLSRGIRIVGELRSRAGRERIENARITLFFPTGTKDITSGSDGAFRAEDLAPGPLRIRIEHDNYVPVEKTLSITTPNDIQRPVQLDPIELQLAGVVEGRVVDRRGDPVVGARVAKDKVPPYLPSGALPTGVVVTDDKGEFRLPGLAEGEVTIEAFAPGIGRGKQEKVTVREQRSTSDIRIELTPEPDSATPAVVASVAVSLAAPPAGRGALVTAVIPGSSAEQAGLQVGDLITAIDSAAVQNERDAHQKLLGPERQEVLLDIQRAQASLKLRVRREQLRQ